MTSTGPTDEVQNCHLALWENQCKKLGLGLGEAFVLQQNWRYCYKGFCSQKLAKSISDVMNDPKICKLLLNSPRVRVRISACAMTKRIIFFEGCLPN